MVCIWQPGMVSYQVNYFHFNYLLLIQQEAAAGPRFCPKAALPIVHGETWKNQNIALEMKRDGERKKFQG